MLKIFLLGGGGFIGKHLLRRLIDNGDTVVTDMRYWDDRFDVIINLAAITHTRNEFDPKLIESNIILPDMVFRRPERIVYMSSCSARHFSCPYSESKLWSEYLGEKHGNAIGLRLFNCYGSGNNKGIIWFLMNQPDKSKITIRGPELIRDYIHIDDVINCIMGSLYATRIGIYDIGSGIGLETMEVVNLYQRLSGKIFHIDVADPHPSEPKEMVSNNPIMCMDLETGLLKTINNA